MRTILLRTSERSQFKRCRQAWYWAFEDGLKPQVAAPALRFGSLVHKAMELRYPPGIRRGPHPAETFERLYEEETKELSIMGFRDDDGKWEDAGEVGVAMMNAFVDEYGKDDRYKVLASEQSFQVEVLRNKKKGIRFVYVGVFDGVWQDRETGRLMLTDWKTAKAISTGHLTLDEQAGSYWAYGPEWMKQEGLLKNADLKNMRGILYTFMRKAKPDPRPKDDKGLSLNKDGTVSKQQPSPLFHREFVYRSEHDAQMLRERVLMEAREMEMIRQGKLGVYINPSPMNCGWCGYRDMCELRQSGGDWEEFRDAAMVKWDPYAEHESFSKSADE